MSTRAKRIATYLNAMFPVAVLLPAALIGLLAVHWTLQALGEPSIVEGKLAVTLSMFLGGLTLFGFQMLLRVYDELKDAETDIRLGKAGDPRYKDRPIVTGEVEVADIEALRGWITAGLFLVNLLVGLLLGWVPFVAFLGVFGLCWLSGKWFFWPAVSRHLLLAFVTHNPLTLAVGVYVIAIYLTEFPGDRPPTGVTLLLLVGLWLPVAAWEIGRKVRLPADETDYQTYSKVLGWRVAATLPGLCVAGSAVCLVLVLRHLEFGWLVPGLVVAGALGPLGAVALLHASPNTARTNLRPWLEGFAGYVNLVLAIAMPVAYGIQLGT